MRQWSLQPVFLGLFRHAPDSPEDSGKSSRLNTCKNLCSHNYKEARTRELTQGENYYRSLAGNKFRLILHMSNFFQISPGAAKIMIFFCMCKSILRPSQHQRRTKEFAPSSWSKCSGMWHRVCVVICSLTWDPGF